MIVKDIETKYQRNEDHGDPSDMMFASAYKLLTKEGQKAPTQLCKPWG